MRLRGSARASRPRAEAKKKGPKTMNDENKFSVDEILEAERKAKANGAPEEPEKTTPGVTEEPDAVTEPETEQPVEEASAEVAQPAPEAEPQPVEVQEDSPWVPTRRKKSPERKRRTKKRRKRKKVFGRAAAKRSRKRFLTKPKTCTTASS